MSVIQISEETAYQYAGRIPPELLNDLEREYFKGLAVKNDDTEASEAVIIWTLLRVDDENTPTEAEILWFRADDEPAGEELFAAFEQDIKEEQVESVSFELETLTAVEKNVLKKTGFKVAEAESRDICVTIGDMAALSFNKKDKKPPEYIMSLSDITTSQFKTGIMTSIFYGRYGIADDLPFLPMTRYDPDISSCVITDDTVNGFLLIHKTLTGEFIVELLFATEPDANINLLNMMRFSTNAAAELCEAEDKVILRRHNTASEALVHKLFPDRKGDLIMKGEKRYGN
ncbi:MAG: hypothetical protein K6G83_10455 [Lachnospiraceae bacterium]|nr:hypothetical protein [Lachnospiraceae bacterium]